MEKTRADMLIDDLFEIVHEEAVAAAMKLGFSESVKVSDVYKEWSRVDKVMNATGEDRFGGTTPFAVYEQALLYIEDFLLLGKKKLAELERVYYGTLPEIFEEIDFLKRELVPAAIKTQRKFSLGPGSRAAA
jgi:hypothetical protein